MSEYANVYVEGPVAEPRRNLKKGMIIRFDTNIDAYKGMYGFNGIVAGLKQGEVKLEVRSVAGRDTIRIPRSHVYAAWHVRYKKSKRQVPLTKARKLLKEGLPKHDFAE